MRNLPLEHFIAVYDERQEQILKDTTPPMSEYRKMPDESDKAIIMSVFTACELSYQQLLTAEVEIEVWRPRSPGTPCIL